MASINQVTLVGKAGQKPKAVPTKTGKKIVSLQVVTTEEGYERADGVQVPPREELHSVTIFGNLAESAERLVRRGSSVYVQGRLHYHTYEDRRTRVKKTCAQIRAEVIQLLDRKEPEEAPEEECGKEEETPRGILAALKGFLAGLKR